MQGVLGFDALIAGLAFLPQSLSIVVGSQVGSRLAPRLGVRTVLVAGAALTAAGFAWFAALDPSASWASGVLGPGVAVALGMGLAFPALASAATTDVEPGRAGLASGLLNTSRQVGGSIGLAVLATVASARASAPTGSGTSRAEALTSGTATAFGIAAVAALLAVAAAALLPGRPAERQML